MTTVSVERQESSIVIDRDANVIEVVRGIPEVTVTRSGPPGPPGPPGGPGPTGPPGQGVAETYIHNQMLPDTEWTINHGLGRYPAVTIVDSAGTVVIGGLRYVDDNTLIVSFDYQFSGKAYLN